MNPRSGDIRLLVVRMKPLGVAEPGHSLDGNRFGLVTCCTRLCSFYEGVQNRVSILFRAENFPAPPGRGGGGHEVS